MRVAGISALTAHLSLHALSAYAADCYSDNRVTDWSVTDVSKLQGTLSELVTDLCKSTPSTHNDRVSTHEVGNVAFHVVHPPTQSLDYFEECKDSFVNIISQCVSDLSFDGGEAKGVNGTIYKVDFEESAGKKLEARRARGGRTRTARPKKTRPKKTRPKKTTPKKKTPKKTTPKKTTPKKTHPKRPKTRKPHSPKTATKKTRTHKPTKTSSSVRTKPTKSCKQIYALAAKEAKTEALKNEKGAKALTIREDTSGVNIFEKRTAKPGSSTCAFRIMNALDYPDVSEMPKGAKYYSFKQPLQCDNFLFGSSSSLVKGLTQQDYQIEHVLEWQVVTKFFDWLKVKLDSKKFDNPNPAQTLANGNRKTIKFCNYLDQTWHGSSTPQFELAFSKDNVKRTPLGHIKWAFPGKKHHEDEFVYLQTTINAPAKEQMWDNKKTTVIYGDTSKCDRIKKRAHWGMTDLIRGHKALGGGICPAANANIDDARQAYLKLKWIYGARQYLKDPHVKSIFKKQKERIGGVLDALDTEMENQPKTNSKGEQQDAWKKQGLKALWDEYMEEKFEMAEKRSKHDMDKYIRLLENVWLPGKKSKGTKGTTGTTIPIRGGKGSKKVARTVGGKATGGKSTGDKSTGKASEPVNSEKDKTVFFAQIQKFKTLWTKEKSAKWDAPWK